MTVLGLRGMTWLATVSLLVVMLWSSWPAVAQVAGPAVFASGHRTFPLMAVAAQSPLEAQMLGDRPWSPPGRPHPGLLMDLQPLLEQSGEGVTLRLPQNFRISFRYHQERSPGMAEHLIQPPVLFKYSMEYRLLPNLQVGMSGFLYQPPADHLTFLQQRRLVLGWGPKLSYDLGRWTFAFQTQMERGLSDGTPGLQNWLRIWYAF